MNLLVAHCLFVSYTAMFTIIPLYVVERGGNETELGIVIGSFGIVGLLVRPLAGRWVYSVGAKQVAAVGTAVFGIATLLHIAAFDVWLIIPARVVPRRRDGDWPGGHGYDSSGIWLRDIGGQKRCLTWATRSRRPACTRHGWPFTCWIRFGFANAFVFAGAAGFIGSAIAMTLSSSRTNIPASGREASYKAPLINRGALFPTLIFVTYTITTAPVNTFLPQIAVERSLGNPGLYFTMYAVLSMVSMAVAGRVSDRLGRGTVIVPGLVVVATGMFILTTAHEQWLFLSAGVLNGLGFGMIQPAMQSLTVDRVPGARAELGAGDASAGLGYWRVGRGVRARAAGVGDRGGGDIRDCRERHVAGGRGLRCGQREGCSQFGHAGVGRSSASNSAGCRSDDELRRDTISRNSVIC